MEDQIVSCPTCHGKNRVPGAALNADAKAKCGHCGAPLSPAAIDEAAGIKAAVVTDPGLRRDRAGKWISGIILSVLATGGYWFFMAEPDPGTTETSATTAATPELLATDPAPEFVPAEPAPDINFPLQIDPGPSPSAFPEIAADPVPAQALEPVWIPHGIHNNWTGTEPVAPLSIVTSYGQNYYVKLVYAGTSTEAISYYIEGGSTADFLAPLGSFELRYASGQTWYGDGELFGPDTTYAKAVGTFDFVDEGTQYTGYTVELILQEGGNLGTEGISRDQF